MKQDKDWILPRKHAGHSKHSLPATQETNLHMDITTYKSSSILATWWKELTHLKRPWCWERLRARGEGDDRVWDDCMASPTQWTWVWVNSGNRWWTGRPGMPVHGVAKSQTQLSEWTEVNWNYGGGNEENGDFLQKVPCKHGYIQCCQHWSRPPLTRTSTETLKHSSASVSVGSLGPGAHKVCLSPLRVSGRYGVWFSMQIHPSYHLAGASPLPLDMGYLLRSMSSLYVVTLFI